MREIAAFVAEHLHDLGPREPEPALMVIPHSYMFSVRNRATAATQRCVRAMSYGCRIAMDACSEYALDRLDRVPRLIVLPSPRVLTDAAWERLIELAEAGATLLVTGPVDADEHWLPRARLDRFGIESKITPVAQREHLEIDGTIHGLSYRGDSIQRVEKAVASSDGIPRTHEVEVGRGRLIWSPLPVELAHGVEPTTALYRHALARAGIEPIFRLTEPDPGILVYPVRFQNALLLGLVSELGDSRTVEIDAGQFGPIDRTLPAGRAELALLRR